MRPSIVARVKLGIMMIFCEGCDDENDDDDDALMVNMMRGHIVFLNTTVSTIIDIILFTFPDKISGLLCPDTRTCLQ